MQALNFWIYWSRRKLEDKKCMTEHPVAYKITIVSYVILAIKTSNNYNNYRVFGAKSTVEVYII